jgi:tRNA(adenine34) deaminase
MSERHAEFMALALEQAQIALEAGEVPVIAACGNMREADADATAHAEILAIRKASAFLGRWRLSDCTLYVTLEPCPMCAGALVQARLGKLVFGAYDEKAGAAGSVYDIPRDSKFNHFVDVVGGFMQEEASKLLSGFFKQKR